MPHLPQPSSPQRRAGRLLKPQIAAELAVAGGGAGGGGPAVRRERPTGSVTAAQPLGLVHRSELVRMRRGVHGPLQRLANNQGSQRDQA